MNDPGNRISKELRPYVDRGDAEDFDRIGALLERTDPDPPRSGFRSELRKHLVDLEADRLGVRWRPRRLRLAAAAYLGSGLALLAVAALAVPLA